MVSERSKLSSSEPVANRHSPIGRKILFHILLFSSFVTLLVTLFQLYSDYLEQTDLVDQRMVQIERSYRDSLANAMWFFNTSQIENILTGIMKFDAVHYVGVKIKNGDEYTQGKQRLEENLRHHEVDVRYQMDSTDDYVGHLMIESNIEGVVQRLSKKFWLILVSQAIKTFCVSMFILFIIYYFVTRHLSTISNFVHGLDLDDKHRDLALSRKLSSKEDEFDQIVDSINRMKRKLIDDDVEQKQTAMKLRTLSQTVEQSTSSILIMDVNGLIEYVNPTFEQSTGYLLTDILGEKSNSLSFGEKTEESYGEIWGCISKGDKWIGELNSRRKDGTQLWESASISSLMSSNQEIAHFLVIKDDISELRQAEQKLRHAQKMEAVGELSGGIAHDFNNILGIVMGNLELLQLKLKDDDKARYRIKKAMTASQRAADLTQKLLRFSRKETLEVSKIYVNDFIENVEALVSTSLMVSIQIEMNLARHLWMTEVDPGELEDTILNLAINARDAMPDGGVLTIETKNCSFNQDSIELHQENKVGEFVLLSVQDTGTGMSDEVKEKSLQPFFTTKDPGKGTGLGLSLVYGFIQRSGGYININTELGKGTTFELYLPRARELPNRLTAAPTEASDLPSGTESILVVDDESALREIACSYLENLGYQVSYASNAKQALEILSEGRTFDLLFSDIIMPGGMDGYQLAIAAKKLDPSLNIMLTSGFTKCPQFANDEDNALIATLTGNTLNKPYGRSALAKAVRQALT